MAIPFRVGETVHELGEFNDRSTEVARVRRAIRDRERLLVYGERRMGKTSILRRAAERERDERGATVLWLDLWSLTTVGDVLRAVLRAVPVAWTPREQLLTLLAGADVRPTLTPGNVPGEGGIALGWSTRDLTDSRARDLLGATLRALDAVAAQHPAPIAIVVDEFQQIDSITPEGGAFLRSISQDTGHLGYVLAGSMLSLIDNLTAPKGPFYNTPRLDVGPIEPTLIEPWIEEQMRSHGVDAVPGLGEAVVALAGPSTEARIKLARETFVLGMAAHSADAATVTRAFQVLVDSMTSAYEATWVGLAEGQRRTLQILANGEAHPTAAETLDRYGVKSSSTVVRATQAMRDQALLTAKDPTLIGDPFFAAWIRTRTAPPPAAHDER
ncbi:MAG: ATP-binding protein [Longimicrobiales bacterium]|nr:ATP-binding protein [Longimicrobiales bacterium]